jgi:hypothetical protein
LTNCRPIRYGGSTGGGSSRLVVDTRTTADLLRLHAQAEQIARNEVGATVSSVSRPISFDGLDARKLVELADLVLPAGPNEPLTCTPVRAGGEERGVIGGPGDVNVVGQRQIPEDGVRLGIAM